MTVTVVMSADQRQILWDHLLQNRVEQVAFVFADLVHADGDTTFTAKDIYLAMPDDFDYQDRFHVTLNDEARARIIKQAWDTNAALVDIHSHPFERRLAHFSPSDLQGMAEFVPHCWWRLRNRPYAAIVVAPKTIDALAWITDPQTPVLLDTINVVGEKAIIPTQLTRTLLQGKGKPRYGR